MIAAKCRCRWEYVACSVSLLFLLFLSGCKTPYLVPTKEHVYTTEKLVSDVDNVAVIVDACFFIDDFKDYVSVDVSKTNQAFMTSSTVSYIENLGYHVDVHNSPFVGGYKSPETKLLVRHKKGDKSQESMPPFYMDVKIAEDIDYQQALLRVLRQVYVDVSQKKESPLTPSDSAPSLYEDLECVQQNLQSRHLLIVIGDSRYVSGMTSFSQGMLTGIATGVLTGGFLAISVYDVSHIDTYAALIDLEQKEVLWANSLRLKGGNVRKKEFYSTWNEYYQSYDGWAKNIFFYIPVKTNKLIEAAKDGNTKCLQWIVQTGSDIDACDDSGMTALHWAVQNNHQDTVKLLLKQGASVSCQDSQGNTPLHYTVTHNQYNLAKLLLDKKACPQIKNNQGKCPLELAAANQQGKKISALLEKHQKKS